MQIAARLGIAGRRAARLNYTIRTTYWALTLVAKASNASHPK